jgi:hypothetical protein
MPAHPSLQRGLATVTQALAAHLRTHVRMRTTWRAMNAHQTSAGLRIGRNERKLTTKREAWRAGARVAPMPARRFRAAGRCPQSSLSARLGTRRGL